MESNNSKPADPARLRRVLSIDGGGLKGLFPAAFLASLEESTGASLGASFDLIAGTSTGGIIALGLGLGFSAQQMLRFYRDLGPQIFTRPGRLTLVRPKYDPESLRRALKAHFKERTLADARTRLVIPSQSLETGDVYIYKTSHHERLQRDFRTSASDVAMATAAAPTYFPVHQDAKGLPLVDGGVWANNPVACAAVEAVGLLGWSNVRILSLGCTQEPMDPRNVRWWSEGQFFWAQKFLHLIDRGQSSGALGMAQHLIGHQNVIRVSPMVAARRFGLDRFDESLIGLASELARHELPRLRAAFIDLGPAERFDPCWPKATHP